MNNKIPEFNTLLVETKIICPTCSGELYKGNLMFEDKSNGKVVCGYCRDDYETFLLTGVTAGVLEEKSIKPFNGKEAVVIDGHFDNPMRAWNWKEGNKIRIKAGLDKNKNQLYQDVPVYSKLPENFVKSSYTIIDGKRFVWIHENKSLFTKEGRKQALLILK